MIGINKEMPICCGGCDFYCIDEIMQESYCYLTKEDLDEYDNEIHPKCPLINLDKEINNGQGK